MSNEQLNSRRSFMNKSGMTLLSSAIFAKGFMQSNTAEAYESDSEPTENENFDSSIGANLVVEKGGKKPVYLAKPEAQDVVTHSIAENLFWVDIMMEHAKFFSLLMPGSDLTGPRVQAMRLQRQFANHLVAISRVRWNNETYKKINLVTIDLVKTIISYKSKMLELQNSGKLKSLVWPTLFAHTIDEANRFVGKLEQLNQGKVIFERKEVVNFWGHIMSEHSQFIAHLLDPQEKELIEKADKFAEQFSQLRSNPGDMNALSNAGSEIIDFKTAAEKGIDTGKIKSIIQPALADHVRREAVKFVDELKRSTTPAS